MRALRQFIALLRNIYYYIISFTTALLTKKQTNLILFDSFNGSQYSDNPLAIYNFIQNYPYEMVWVFKNKPNGFTGKYVKSHSIKHFIYLSKAKFWIFNFKTPPYFIKDKATIYLQTWHGIPLKRLGNDIIDTKITYYRSMQSYQQMVNSYTNEGLKVDYFITPSLYGNSKLSSAFKLHESKCLNYGYPRNDLLYHFDDKKINEYKKQLKISIDKKIILYAPTWRDNSSSISGYQGSSLLDLESLVSSLNNEYIILYRPHYLIKDIFEDSEYIKNVSNFDISILYILSDILITDYSSVYFDYSILKRPIYFYMPDLALYQDNLRGFYIDINKDLPNDYHTKQDELVDDIKNNLINKEKQSNFYLNNVNYDVEIKDMLKYVGIRK